MSNTDIQALLNGTAAIQTKIEILPQVAGESSITLTESNGVVSWDYEDFRFIKGQGFIGQFIAKKVTGTIKNPSDNFSMTDREFKLQMGIKVGNTLTWYSLGNFLVTKVTDDEVKDTTKFEALDYVKKFNKRYEDTITYPCTMLELVQNICNQCGCELGSTNFKHKDWVIDGNYFQNNESCRDVMKNLGKLAYSWVRVDWDNKVYFDFTKKTTVDSYNKITNHEYYSLTTQKEKKIINRVVIGYSNIDGEQTKVEDTASIKANGLCEITIFDNPLVYNQALREKAIVGASDLLGLEYTPLEMQTVGHPWLKGYELIEATDMEGKVYKTIPFNRTIQYFGHIKSLIKIETETKTNTEYAYESGLKNDFLNAQIQVNKKLGTITSTVDEMNTKVEDITTTTQTSTGGNSLYLKEALESNALEYSVDGRCEQETRSGKNLYNFKDTTYVGNGVTTDEDGWITITADNTSGTSVIYRNYFTKNLKLKTNTNYAIVMEVKNVSRTGDNAIWPVSVHSTTEGQFDGGYRYDLATLSNNTIKVAIRVTKSDFTNISNGLRTFLSVGAGAKSTITFRLSVLEDTTVTAETFKYEAFGASPSPDYPSEIKTIKGIRNLLNSKVASQIIEGITFTHNDDGTVRASGTTGSNPANYNLYNNDFDLQSGTYTLSGCPNGGSSSKYYIGQNIASAYGNEFGNGLTFTINSDVSDKSIWLSIRPNQTVDILFKPMLEQGSVAHSYVPYGTYEKIKVTGKNIFNIQKWLNATFPVVHGVLNSKTSNSISLTSTADDCYTQTFSMSTITNKTTIDNFGFEIEENTDYTFYTKKSDTIGGTNFVFYFDKDYKYISLKSNNSITNENFLNFTTPPNAKYICFRLGINKSGNTVEFSNIMLLKGTITTTPDYEPYKEKEVLIDLAKENLLETPYTESNKLTATATKNDYYAAIDYYAELEAGKTYTFSCKTDGTFGASNQQTQCYLLFDKKYDYIIHMDDKNCFKFTPTQTGKYYVRYDVNVKGETHSFWDFAIYKGTNADDSYELNSIGDIKDKLEIINGVVDIQKRIGKIVLNGSENWEIASKPTFNAFLNRNLIKDNSLTNLNGLCDFYDVFANEKWSVMPNNSIIIGRDTRHQILIRNDNITTAADFKSWLKANPVTVYYELNEPETITLPNTNIPLYEGVNHVTLIEDLETTTSIKYLRKTPISGEYALNQDLNKTNSNLADTNNQLSQAQSDISSTNTNLNNNYYNKEQVDSINSTTTQNITQIRNTMEQNITSTNASISKIQEEITNGVSKVTTTTGTFDENGLNISKSGQPMSSTLDWDGLEVVRDKGKATETEVLTVRSAGVEAENMTVRNFFIEKPIRIEKCKSVTDSTKVGLGFFWIGE